MTIPHRIATSAAAVPSIDQLQELALPVAPFSYWPQTWGWLVVALVAACVAVCWGVLRWRRWRQNAYRREALSRLDALASALNDDTQRLHALRELPGLLKRVALSMPAAPAVARLGGSEWQTFLAGRAAHPLPGDFAAKLYETAYAPDKQVLAMPDTEVQSLFATSRRWIETHRVAV